MVIRLERGRGKVERILTLGSFFHDQNHGARHPTAE
jgi:hypothetical protein